MAALDSPFYGLLCIATKATTPLSTPPANHVPILPDLHLNIWEKGDVAFLDIGLMLDVHEAAATFELLVPWPVQDGDLEDLSDRLFEKSAVPAIFNEGWEITRGVGNVAGRVGEPGSQTALFLIMESHSELKVSPFTYQGKRLASVSLDIASLRRKASAPNGAPKMYVRFRVKEVPKDFYRVGIDQKDRFLVSSWQRTEIIDFRLNVRRGVPLGLEQSIGQFVEFSKVHLFLMKSRDQDIVFEDTLFKACRSLEDEDFWAGYSLSKTADSSARQENLKHVRQSLGYQWSKVATTTATGALIPVREYGILARYKNIRFGIGKFIFIALVVGAMGNATWDGAKILYAGSALERKIELWTTSKHEGSDAK